MTATDTTEETPVVWLGLGEVATRYGVDVDTVGRWHSQGVWRKGQLVKLQCIWVGARRKTRPEWVEAFLSACNDVPEPISTETAGEEKRRREKEQAALARKLGKT